MTRTTQWDSYQKQIQETGEVQVRTLLLATAEQLENMADLIERPVEIDAALQKQIADIDRRIANTIATHALAHDLDEKIDAAEELDEDSEDLMAVINAYLSDQRK